MEVRKISRKESPGPRPAGMRPQSSGTVPSAGPYRAMRSPPAAAVQQDRRWGAGEGLGVAVVVGETDGHFERCPGVAGREPVAGPVAP